MRIIRTYLTSFDEDVSWPDLVPIARWAYNSTPVSTNVHSPFELIFCRTPHWAHDSLARMDNNRVPTKDKESLLQYSLKLRKDAHDRAKKNIAKE